MKINISKGFKRSYKKLPIHIQKDFDKKIFIEKEINLLDVGHHDIYKKRK